MLLNDSYKNPEQTKSINSEVGPPFTLATRIKLGGIGSPKLHISAASIGIHNLLAINEDTNTCIIELRPKGILIRFRVRLETYVLVIPYYKLVVYKGKPSTYTFYRDQFFLSIHAAPQDTPIHSFVKKMMAYKNDNSPTSIEDL